MNKKALVGSLAVLVIVCFGSMMFLSFGVNHAQGEGLSMVPTFDSKGDMMFYTTNLDANLTGHIVMVQVNSTFRYVHRVVSDNGTIVWTQGDNRETNPLPDVWTPTRAQIVGEVYAYLPLWEFYLIFLLLILICFWSVIILSIIVLDGIGGEKRV
jgi:hypothetical protein